MYRFMQKLVIAFGVLCWFASAPAVHAGDQAEHRYLSYAIAIASGYSPEDARVISDGAWSLDANPTTIATPNQGNFTYATQLGEDQFLNMTIGQFAGLRSKELCENDDEIDRLFFSPNEKDKYSGVGRGIFYHALFDDPAGTKPEEISVLFAFPVTGVRAWHTSTTATPSLIPPWRKYFDEQLTNVKHDKKTRLLLIGQFLHMYLDSFVHPPNSLIGHAPYHTPDYAIEHPDWYKSAVRGMITELRTKFPPDKSEDRFAALNAKLEDLIGGTNNTAGGGKPDFASNVVDALVDGYKADAPGVFRRLWQQFWRNQPFGEPSETDLANTKTKLNEFMREFLRSKTDYSGRYKEDFEVPPYTTVTYTRDPNDSSRFTVKYGDKDMPGLDNFVQWVLKHKGEYDGLLKTVRKSIRLGLCCDCGAPAKPKHSGGEIKNEPVPPSPSPVQTTIRTLPQPMPGNPPRSPHLAVRSSGSMSGGHGSRLVPVELPHIPPACTPNIIDLVLGLINKFKPGHETDDHCDKLARRIDEELTIIDKAKHIEGALGEREKALREAVAARNKEAQRQQRDHEAAFARYKADVVRYNSAVQQRREYESAVARYNVELTNYNSAVQQRAQYQAAVERYNRELASYHAAQQQMTYQPQVQYGHGGGYQFGHGGGGHGGGVHWGEVAGAAASIIDSFLGGGGHHH